jgi:hypothetical protein
VTAERWDEVLDSFGIGPDVAGMGEADGPPVEAAQHGIHGALGAFRIAERALCIELFPGAGKADGVANGDRMEFRKDESELFDGAQAG